MPRRNETRRASRAFRDDARFTAFTATPVDVAISRSLERRLRDPAIVRLVILPDVHLAGEVCVGCVIATRDRIFPEAVGGDIGCGVTTIRCELPADRIDNEETARRILLELPRVVPIRARESAERDLPLSEELDAQELSFPHLERSKHRDGRAQFATLGRGNHFLELERSISDGALHVSVHSGSRAMGPAIRDAHLRGATREGGAGLPFLLADSPAGLAYRRDVAWAIAYAAASRRAILERVVAMLQSVLGEDPRPEEVVDCNHNHVAREVHGNEPLWVHRKGALAAGSGVLGIIPGSMGTSSFLVEGRGEPSSLASSSHGAGRELARGAAARELSLARVRRSLHGVWFDDSRLPELLDEAPEAYKDIDAVMRAQRTLTRIRDRLEPVLSWKGA